jgi:hypothetical protein
MIERFLVKFQDGRRDVILQEVAQTAANNHDEIIYPHGLLSELYRCAKFIPKITHEIEGLMAK